MVETRCEGRGCGPSVRVLHWCVDNQANRTLHRVTCDSTLASKSYSGITHAQQLAVQCLFGVLTSSTEGGAAAAAQRVAALALLRLCAVAKLTVVTSTVPLSFVASCCQFLASLPNTRLWATAHKDQPLDGRASLKGPLRDLGFISMHLSQVQPVLADVLSRIAACSAPRTKACHVLCQLLAFCVNAGSLYTLASGFTASSDTVVVGAMRVVVMYGTTGSRTSNGECWGDELFTSPDIVAAAAQVLDALADRHPTTFLEALPAAHVCTACGVGVGGHCGGNTVATCNVARCLWSMVTTNPPPPRAAANAIAKCVMCWSLALPPSLFPTDVLEGMTTPAGSIALLLSETVPADMIMSFMATVLRRLQPNPREGKGYLPSEHFIREILQLWRHTDANTARQVSLLRGLLTAVRDDCVSCDRGHPAGLDGVAAPALRRCTAQLFAAAAAPQADIRNVAAELVAALLRMDIDSAAKLRVVIGGPSAGAFGGSTSGAGNIATLAPRFFSAAAHTSVLSNGGETAPGPNASSQDFRKSAAALEREAKAQQTSVATPPPAPAGDGVPAAQLGAQRVQLPPPLDPSAAQHLQLVMTTSTSANLSAVLEAVDSATPLLIQGATGVGKSATIAAAATVLNKPPETLLRMNMSSKVTVDDLLGKVLLKSDASGTEQFVFEPQAFTKAFQR